MVNVARSCSNCRYWEKMEDVDEGLCKRYPPEPIGYDEQGTVIMVSAGTEAVDWCGEWKGMECH